MLKTREVNVRMYADGSVRPYTGRNGGGYTLEAFFGIRPNGLPFPDYKGWELKSLSGSVATLMTPQPDGGIYNRIGNDEFVRKFGHLTPDGRMYFTGKISSVRPNDNRLVIVDGFDASTGKITNENGYVGLVKGEELLASWSFPHLINHWQTKHSLACYVRYRKLADKNLIDYKPEVLLCEKTSAAMLFQALAAGYVFLDPACREGKPRNQFRTSYNRLFCLYEVSECVDLSLINKLP